MRIPIFIAMIVIIVGAGISISYLLQRRAVEDPDLLPFYSDDIAASPQIGALDRRL